jgi:hypothetical protein
VQTIQLQVDDSKLETFLTLISNLKDGMVKNLTLMPSDELDNETKTYMQTKQFEKDKAYFQKCLDDIENGKTKTQTFNIF